MFVSDILHKKGSKVFSMYPTAQVGKALKEMDARSIGAVVVVDAKGAVKGVVSERDIVQHLARRGTTVLDDPLSALMPSKVHTRSPDADVADIMSLMTYQRLRHVPIVDNGQLCGLISIGDVVKQRLEDMELEVGVLRDVARISAH
ncbi:MAG: CBS domain-containing protein [Rhodospirillales bacterium]